MPEGDTILRAAQTLGKVLGGQKILRFRSSLPKFGLLKLDGLRVEKVESRGKNLFMHFEDGFVLRTHMMMTGSWHVYRHGEKWWKPEHLARVVLETEKFVVVCFNAPVIELLSPVQFERKENVHSLGPDILSDTFDVDEVLRRFRERKDWAIGEAVLAQRAVAGIGNIYKSETLFLCRVNPFLRVDRFSEADLKRIVSKARKLMLANVNTAARTTRLSPGNRFWVYGRSGKPCLRCGRKIEMRRQGDARRSTYFCPRCQGVHQGFA